MLSSELLSNLGNTTFHISSEVSGVSQKMVVSEKWLKRFSVGIDVLDSIINTILTNVFSWEPKPIRVSLINWSSIVNVVHLFQMELLEVLHKSSEEMSLWHFESGILVVTYNSKENG